MSDSLVCFNPEQTNSQWLLENSAVEYLEHLVAFNTVSSTDIADDHSTSELVDFLIERFTQNHMFCIKFEQIKGKFNLLALSLEALKHVYHKSSLGLLFSGHADTVPFNASAWQTEPLKLHKRDGKLYGRGSVDMKGFIACVAALTGAKLCDNNGKEIKSSKENSSLIGERYAYSCLITSDEETSMDGAQMLSQLNQHPLHSLGISNPVLIYDREWTRAQAQTDSEFAEILDLIASRPSLNENAECKLALCEITDGTWLDQAFIAKQFDLIVIGEPTSMQAVVAHKGWMARTLKVQGKTAHSSNPDLGCNAISLLTPLLQSLEQFTQELKGEHADQRFAVPQVTLNLGRIQGGQAHNTVCDQVSLDFDVRPIPSFSNQQVQARLEQIVDEYNQKLGEQRCELTIPFADIDCFENTDLHSLSLLKQAIIKLQNRAQGQYALSPEFQCVNYCTEASLLQKLGPCVVMGPGSIAQAHQENEFIELEQLNLCMQLLLALVESSEQA